MNDKKYLESIVPEGTEETFGINEAPMGGSVVPADPGKGTSKEYVSGRGLAEFKTVQIEIKGGTAVIMADGKQSPPVPFGKFVTSQMGKDLVAQGVDFSKYTKNVDPPVDFTIVNGKIKRKNPEE